MAKSALEKQADKFNKKFKVGNSVSYKDSKGNGVAGKLIHEAVAQETQVSIWIEGVKGKISLKQVTSKF